MKTLMYMAFATLLLTAVGASSAQTGTMMNSGGMWSGGWMGGYGGFWVPILLVVIVGLVVWIVVQRRLNGAWGSAFGGLVAAPLAPSFGGPIESGQDEMLRLQGLDS